MHRVDTNKNSLLLSNLRKYSIKVIMFFFLIPCCYIFMKVKVSICEIIKREWHKKKNPSCINYFIFENYRFKISTPNKIIRLKLNNNKTIIIIMHCFGLYYLVG